MRIQSDQRAVMLLTALLCAVALVACEQTADLIPNAPPPTETPVESAGGAPAPTPITVNPDGSLASDNGPEQVIADHDLALSVVQILIADNSAGFEQIVRYATGVVIDADARLIVTAYPAVNPYRGDGTPAYSSIIVAADRVPGTEPQREFVAELVAADPSLDLAILRVTGRIDGEPLGDFDLPAATVGDATSAGVGFSLRLFGYPGIAPGGSTAPQIVETAQATISGQRGIVGRTGRTWFKTDARMPFGSAGGPAFDRFGALVGVLAQDRYLPTGSVAQVRPLDLVSPLVTEARRTTTPYSPALYRTATLPGALRPVPESGIHVSQPSFAENAIEAGGGRDLFDYETRFTSGLGALYYEYEVNGVPDEAIIEERWFLNGVQQESLSSSFIWSQGLFGYVSDRITAPSPAGMPPGRWQLDVYVDDVLHATGIAIIGVPLSTPSATYQFAASAATGEGNIAIGAFSGASQLLMMFDVTGMSGATNLEWHIYRDNQQVYTSPGIRWGGADSGRFWVGYAPSEGIGPGTWEFELHADGNIIGVGTIPLF